MRRCGAGTKSARHFCSGSTQYRGVALLVSNEVGSGIVPASALARRFQDEQGRLNQEAAALCDAVTLVVAGIAVAVKPR